MVTGSELARQLRANLKAERVRAGLTQAQLAEALGVGEDVVQSIEVGRRAAGFVEVVQIAVALDVPMTDICRRFDPEVLRTLAL